ncbi:MAG: aminopeptidase P family protein [Brevinematales bacterium]|nr:aminopeptidase P family protein [Brevinematales bacterium]
MQKNYFLNRIEKLISNIEEKDAFLITLPEEVHYLSGFTGEDSYLLVNKNEIAFFTDLRFVEQIKREKKIELNIYDISGKKIIDSIVGNLKQNKIERLFLSKKDLNFQMGENLSLYLMENMIEVKDSNLIKKMRERKDEYEIEIIRQNLLLTELSYNIILPKIEEDKTEIELASELEYFLRKNGIEKMSFDTIIASGERTVLPHGRASEKRIKYEEVIMFDYGIKKKGYCSDFTRCFYFGKIIGSEILKLHSIVKDALKEAEKIAKPGIQAKEVHLAAYNVIEKAGYAQNFWHSTGHGVGLEIHEEPSISSRSETILEEGMVFTIEPGIYIPGICGIRLEDMVVIRKNGCEVLTSCDYDL